MPVLRFPDDLAVGTLEWLGALPGPTLARGAVEVPDGVAVGLEVMPIERVDRDGDHAWTLKAASGPLDLDFVHELPPHTISTLTLHAGVSEESLLALPHLAPGLTDLTLAWTDYGDGALPHVARLVALTRLQTFGNRFTDPGVQQLASLSELVQLHLEEASLGADAFAFADRLPRLELLGLQDVDLGPHELAHLRARLPGIDVLV